MVISGPFSVAAALLLAAALSKLWHPAPTVRALRMLRLPGRPALVRLGALGEAAIASAALVTGGRIAAAAVALSYVAFAGVVGVALAGNGRLSSCGCFGGGETPPTMVHLVLDAALAAVSVAAAVRPPGPFRAVASHTPLWGVPFLGFVGLAAWFAYLASSGLGRLEAAAKFRGPARDIR